MVGSKCTYPKISPFIALAKIKKKPKQSEQSRAVNYYFYVLNLQNWQTKLVQQFQVLLISLFKVLCVLSFADVYQVLCASLAKNVTLILQRWQTLYGRGAFSYCVFSTLLVFHCLSFTASMVLSSFVFALSLCLDILSLSSPSTLFCFLLPLLLCVLSRRPMFT